VSGASGALIVLEGIDGAGKTALRDRVAERLGDVGLIRQSTKEVARAPDFAHESMTRVAGLLWPAADTSFDHLLRPEYWLYLQALWYTLASQFVIAPKLERGDRLLTDGWYFKFYAKLRLRGFEADFLDAVFRPAAAPDLVVFLDADVASVWGRKQFRLAEMGLHHDYAELGRDSFVDYQSRVRSALVELAASRGWTTVRVAGGEELERTAEHVEHAIRAFVDSR
jgi:dTMP kinase